MNFFLLSLLLSVSSVLSQNCTSDYSSDIQNNIDNGCPWSWQYFDRPSGGWCMKVFLGRMNQTDAELACNEHNATLSGVQTKEEDTFLKFMASVEMKAKSGIVWLGAKRTEACWTSKGSATCTRNTTFEWTDGSVTGQGYFSFQAYQPDNSGLDEGTVSACLNQFVQKPSYTGPESYRDMDDIPCETVYPRSADTQFQGYVCGKKTKF